MVDPADNLMIDFDQSSRKPVHIRKK